MAFLRSHHLCACMCECMYVHMGEGVHFHEWRQSLSPSVTQHHIFESECLSLELTDWLDWLSIKPLGPAYLTSPPWYSDHTTMPGF